MSGLIIKTRPEQLQEGLFGQIFLYVFEVLPFLQARRIYPAWEIYAQNYARQPGQPLVPGVVDLAYTPEPNPSKTADLIQMRGHHRQVLGNDWSELSAMWHSYFRIPNRIRARASEVGSLDDAIGIHYRGNDKLTELWDSNPTSREEYLTIVEDFCQTRPALRRIFLATDDALFEPLLKARLPHQVVTLGAAGFHKAPADITSEKADNALLDCLLLSKCAVVLETSSALPSFAKILNPGLEIYRASASKFFMNSPYFPVGFIPIYRSTSPEITALIDRLTIGDWTRSPDAERFTDTFTSRSYWPPALRVVYTFVRNLPGFSWVGRMPDWLAFARRNLKLTVRKFRA